MLQGTGSDVGGRAPARRGTGAAPMRAPWLRGAPVQAAEHVEQRRRRLRMAARSAAPRRLQARACYVAPLGAPGSGAAEATKASAARSSFVVQEQGGRATAGAREYQQIKRGLMGAGARRLPSLVSRKGRPRAGRGRRQAPAEVNLRDGDIANMGFAEAADLPVLLVARLSSAAAPSRRSSARVALLESAERARDQGLYHQQVSRRSRLFDGGIELDRARMTGLDALGIVPWFARSRPSAGRDSLALERASARPASARFALPWCACRTSPISTISIPLARRARREPSTYRAAGPASLPADADLILLPGVEGDARRSRLSLRPGLGHRHPGASPPRRSRSSGLCAGYQMLGTRVADPAGIEGAARRLARPRPARCRDGAEAATSSCVSSRAPAGRRR